MIETTDADLTAALAVPRWVRDVAAGSPYATLDALLTAAHAAATPLSTTEIDEAISHHPRIGEKPAGDGKSQAFSRSEQGDSQELAVELAAGNRAYEERFGRVFIIRAAGRSRAEIFAELERRLALPDDQELAIVGEQLRDIAVLRLEKLYGESA